jgi:hypothetical protein
MAQQTIQVGAAPNDNTGDFIRDAFIKVNANFTELYTDDAGDVNSVNGQTGTVVLDSDDIAEGSTNEYYTEAKVSANTSVAANTAKVTNATHSGDVTGSTTLTIAADAVDGTKIADDSIDSEHYVDGSIDTAHIADDQITYAKMGTEFTTAAVISASDVNFSSAQVFTKQLSGATTLTFSNVSTGMVKDLVIIGNQTLTLPASVKTISGTYDGTVSNLIQIVSTNGSTEQWATISQEA